MWRPIVSRDRADVFCKNGVLERTALQPSTRPDGTVVFLAARSLAVQDITLRAMTAEALLISQPRLRDLCSLRNVCSHCLTQVPARKHADARDGLDCFAL